MVCVINHPLCKPDCCNGCGREFCAHELPDTRAIGYYGEYCSETCRAAKRAQILELAQTHFKQARLVLVVEERYCYLVPNHAERYGFKILSDEGSGPLYTYADRWCPALLTYAMTKQLTISYCVTDEKWQSMWTIRGFRFVDGSVDVFGVGEALVVIDQRASSLSEMEHVR